MFSEKKKFSKKKIVIGSIIAVVLVCILSVSLYINGMLGEVKFFNGPTKSSYADDDTTNANNSPKSDIDKLNSEVEKNLKNKSIPLAYDKDVFNVLLIGTDSRADVGGSRSDSMIILSINRKTQKLVMTSVMRDIYLNIPGHKNSRLNSAFAYGGPQLLMQTIQENFRIKIDKYMSVDFYNFIDVIDKLGGVRISVTSKELPVLNNYINEINALKGLPKDDGILKQAGNNLLLTGKQALGYSRIRYVGNGDYQRTERQRTVLMQVFGKLKGQNIFKLNDVLNTMLPDVTTNLSKGELFTLVLSGPVYSKYTVEQDRIPIDGTDTNLVINHMDVLGIDFTKNIEEMQSRIYGK